MRLLAPVPDPEKIICMGLNYRDHAEEANQEIPDNPRWFAQVRELADRRRGGGGRCPPPHPDFVDYEAELAVVIGKPGRGIGEADALGHVAGAMPLNDVSARDLQLQSPLWTAGKAIDTFAPCGPALVTADEAGNLDDLELRTRINGEVVQEGTTSQMIFGVAETIAWLSRTMTLVPGDIIATGTPAGVGGFKGLFLKDGDTVEVEVEGLGAVSNPIRVRGVSDGVLAPEVEAFLDAERVGALATVSEAGRPRQSVVYFVRDGEQLLISTEAGRWKAKDVGRTGWASLCVHGSEPPFPSATLAGPAEIRTEDIGPGTAAVMGRIMGLDEPPEAQSDEALAEVGRVLLAITIERVGPVTYLDPAG